MQLDHTRSDLLAGLVRHGLLIPTGVSGVFGWGESFEAIIAGLGQVISTLAAGDAAEIMRFPPVTSRNVVEACGYLQTFPQFLGMIHAFCGDESAHLKMLSHRKPADWSWSTNQAPLDIVLTPAACYPVYPVLAARGALPEQGYLVDVASYCFRHEPSDDPARLQSFRLREFVRVGSANAIVDFRDSWTERAMGLIGALGLSAELVPANDPFFGAQSKFLSEYQDENKLKFELRIGVTAEDSGTACMSFNCHLDHFARACDIRDHAGDFAHSGCVGFGMERLALALIARHGYEVNSWIDKVLRPGSRK